VIRPRRRPRPRPSGNPRRSGPRVVGGWLTRGRGGERDQTIRASDATRVIVHHTSRSVGTDGRCSVARTRLRVWRAVAATEDRCAGQAPNCGLRVRCAVRARGHDGGVAGCRSAGILHWRNLFAEAVWSRVRSIAAGDARACAGALDQSAGVKTIRRRGMPAPSNGSTVWKHPPAPWPAHLCSAETSPVSEVLVAWVRIWASS
jgi:hypothetical protein